MCTVIPRHHFERAHSPLSARKRSRSCLGRGGACRKSLIILLMRLWRELARVDMSVGMSCSAAAGYALSLQCQQASAKVPHKPTCVIDRLLSGAPFETLQPCMTRAERAQDVIISFFWHSCGSHFPLTVSKQRLSSAVTFKLCLCVCREKEEDSFGQSTRLTTLCQSWQQCHKFNKLRQSIT